jgi:N-acetylmuramic acid 6-phosphate etherase
MSTEDKDPRFADIDSWPTDEAVGAMLEEQIAALAAVRSQVAAIAAAAEAAATRLSRSGRLVYAGAGTSGRIAVQDGVELEPTYGWPRERLLFVMAGGAVALTESVEGAEDDADAGRSAMIEHGVGADDVVIGVAASGRTPFTVALIEEARSAGALTIAIANNAATPVLHVSEFPIVASTGAEVIAGSTRMKAGTAQKAILNMLSTAVMLRAGLVYKGFMVSMRISNEKLRRRGEAIVRELTGADPEIVASSLERGASDIRSAVLIASGMEPTLAARLLQASRGDLREAIARSQAGADAHA